MNSTLHRSPSRNPQRLEGGLLPTVRSRRDYSLTRTFGAPSLDLPDEYDVEAEKGDVNGPRDQEDNFCAAYTISEIGADEHGIEMDAHAQALFISMLAGKPILDGASMRDAIRSGRTFGFLPVKDCPFHDKRIDREKVASLDNWPLSVLEAAKSYRMPAFFWIDGPYDAFDNHRAQLYMHRPDNGIALGVPWHSSFNSTSRDGMVMANTAPAEGRFTWHAITLKGFMRRRGKEVLKIRSWNKRGGNRTYYYFDRPTFNAMMRTLGAASYMYKDVPDDVLATLRERQFDLARIFSDLVQRIMVKLKYGV